MEAIHRLNPELTIIMVAHRLTTLERCDEILDLGWLQKLEIKS
jgi:ABC-type multidrug transport system fused ATPase/permease subunit